jgi:hypothetical protein
MNVQSIRKIGPIQAFLAGFFGVGLGYVYVGELRLAFAGIFGTVGVLVLCSWTRLIVASALVYWIFAGLIITASLVVLIHPIVIAVRHPQRPRKSFNRWWFYLLWAVVTGTGSYFIVLVEIRDGVLYRNDHAVIEPYLHPPIGGYGYGRDHPATSVGPDEVFVLGDYRDNSVDSRGWGALPTSKLRGRVQYIWFSTAGRRVQWARIGISWPP